MKAGGTYWLIGASAGLGRALAEEMASEGMRLILSARSLDKLEALAEELPGEHQALALDVTDKPGIAEAVERLPEIDGVVYIAGDYEPMAARDLDPERAEQVSEINYFGALRTVGRIAPKFAARGHGHIVIIGSIAGLRGLPGAIGYGASKAAVMHFAENLRADLWRTDVKVQQINPGFIRTRLTDKNEFDMPQILEPKEAAEYVWKAMKTNRFSTSFPNPFALLFRVGRILPQGLFDRLFAGQDRGA